MINISEKIMGKLLKPYELQVSELEFLGGGREDSDGIVYSYLNKGSKMVFKTIAWKCDKEGFDDNVNKNNERINFVHYAGQNGANIVFPSKSPQGSLYHSHYEEGEGYGYLTYIMEFVSGKQRGPKEWDEAFYRRWGSAIGKMHRIATQYPAWQCSQKLNAKGLPLLGWEAEWDELNALHYDEDVKQKWQELRRELSNLPQNRDVFGFIHNDPHHENILDDGTKLYLIDFDVSSYHWFANDIAIALQSTLFNFSGGIERPVHDKEALKWCLTNILEGYEKEHHIDNEWIEKLDLFVAYRRILLFIILKGMLQGNKELYDSWKQQILNYPRYILECIK
ncbi:phosphotransferase [Clostridiaceae bacterium M8S5]|nr:phosphotransferase [Clostridiaceae bacterium M8S5]